MTDAGQSLTIGAVVAVLVLVAAGLKAYSTIKKALVGSLEVALVAVNAKVEALTTGHNRLETQLALAMEKLASAKEGVAGVVAQNIEQGRRIEELSKSKAEKERVDESSRAWRAEFEQYRKSAHERVNEAMERGYEFGQRGRKERGE